MFVLIKDRQRFCRRFAAMMGEAIRNHRIMGIADADDSWI